MVAALALAALLAAPLPIPEGPDAAKLQALIGTPATPHPVKAAAPPRHPYMAPNGRSNLHVDAYQTDVHQGPGPLGRAMRRTETFVEGDCASVTFDAEGRIVTVCVGLEGPKRLLLDARTLETLATFPLPPRIPGGGNVFNDPCRSASASPTRSRSARTAASTSSRTSPPTGSTRGRPGSPSPVGARCTTTRGSPSPARSAPARARRRR